MSQVPKGEATTLAPISAAYSSLIEKLNRPNIPSLDGIRGIAALLVVFYHFGMYLHFYPLPGFFGVLTFFVLSGFLITWLLLKEDAKTGDISLGHFYIRRSLRIFPAFYAYWLFTIGMRFLAHRSVPWTIAFAAFFYVSNYYYALLQPTESFMMQTWSLAIEEQFYLLWPLLFRKGRRNLRGLSIFLVVAIGSVWLWRPLLRYGFGARREYLQYAFDCRIDALFVGCLLAILLRQQRLQSAVRVICFHPLAAFLPIAVLTASIHFSNSIGKNYAQIVGFPVEEVCVVLLLIQLITFSEYPVWRWLNSGVARFFGRISYSLYLYQNVSFQYFPQPLRSWIEASSTPVKLIAGLAISISMATVSYYVVEKFFLRIKDSFLAKKNKIGNTVGFTPGHEVPMPGHRER